MEKLQSLADKILAECDRHGNTLEQLEERVCQFESSCTTLSPEEAAQVVEELMKEIKVRKGGRREREEGRRREGERERERRMEGGREREKEREGEWREGGREREKEREGRWRDGGREGGRSREEGGREGGREREGRKREGGRKGGREK